MSRDGRARRVAPAAALLVLGVAAFILGGALAWGTSPLLGFSIGSAGVVAVVVGAVLVRSAMVDRFVLGDREGEERP